MQLYYKLVLSIFFLLAYRLWKACLTIVWHSFKQNHAQRRVESGCFGFNGPGQKDVVAVFPHEFWVKFYLPVVRAVKHKQKEKNVVLVAS